MDRPAPMDRAPLDTVRLSEMAAPWVVTVLEETGSTNADLAVRARHADPEGTVVCAETQTAGRGRLGRSWQSPPRAGLAISVLLRPEVDTSRWGWLPLLAGLAVVEAVAKVAHLDARLKWPNDILLAERKCAGLLAEVAAPGAVVVGIGLNVSLREAELPTSPSGLPATSLLLAGAGEVDRTALAAALLTGLRLRYESWRDAGGDPDRAGLRAAYVERCATLGRQVRVVLPAAEFTGVAESVDGDGRLLVRAGDGVLRPVAAGDVVHLR